MARPARHRDETIPRPKRLTAEGGRAPIVSVRFDRAHATRLEGLARARGQRRSDLVRDAVAAYLVAEEAATA